MNPAAPSKPKILVIDDEPMVRSAISLLLRIHGFAVSEAEHGAAGLERARQEKPDLILSDLNMGPLDGLELLRELRGDPALRDVPFVLVTAEVHSERFAKTMLEGADGHVCKPFAADDLLAAVGSQLDRCR